MLAGMALRMCFALAADHGAGDAIAHFSRDHGGGRAFSRLVPHRPPTGARRTSYARAAD
ncbi:hypothetical protein [Streptomyces sp. MST-110588]|uniref:hypothetical protein n=1 Tax=Streptomyces sp. MST-110588 TaxID=2833628 RepID=UPI001F5DA04F|nr:hypothetical protein [Streptomyces sp. MST-110588]UNO40826.1 hypothetical protein KGS77_16115 [Streptomyces sp. MST-110588]